MGRCCVKSGTDERIEQRHEHSGGDVTEDRITSRDLIGGSTPGELDLFPFVMLLRSHLPRTLLLTALGAAIAVGYTHTRKPRYSATGSILIPQNSESASGSVLQAATGLDLLGGGYEVYLDIMHSRSIQDRLIDQYDLGDHYKVGKGNYPAAEGLLTSRTTMFAAKEGLLWLVVEDEDPKLAENLVNSYFTELSQLNARLGITAATQLRRYYEAEMVKEKNTLADAEAALEQSQQKNGVLEPGIQANAEFGAEESTRAQLRARQIELEGLLQGATAQNPEVIRLKAEIGGLESQLQALQQGGGMAAGTPASRAPAQALDYVRKSREVKFQSDLLDAVTRQYENARAQESKDISLVEVLDTARATTVPVWPPAHSWMMLGAALGFLTGILWTALVAFSRVVMSNPHNRERVLAVLMGRSRGMAARKTT